MIFVIITVAFLIRLISINQSLWLDEAIIVEHLKNISFFDAISKYAIADFHPPGYVILIWSWIRLFGSSEISVRIPSVIFGIGTIICVYLIGYKLVSTWFGVLSSLFLAVNPLHVYYSQEARMYSFAAFDTSLNMLFFIKLLNKEKYSFLGFILSGILLLSSDYLAIFIIFTQLAFLVLTKRYSFVKKWLLGFLISSAFLIWWVPLLIKQFQLGLTTAERVPGWKEVVGGFGLKPAILTYTKFIIGRVSIDNNLIYALVLLPTCSIFLFLLIKSFYTTSKEKYILLSWLFVPTLITWLISAFLPIFSYFRMLFVLPAFLMLIALGAVTLKKASRKIFIFLVLLIQITCTFIYLLSPNFHREDWKGLITFIEQQPNTKLVLLENTSPVSPINYYAENRQVYKGALKTFPAYNSNDIVDLEKELQNVEKTYLVDYLVEISDPNRQVAKKLESLGFVNTNTYNFNGVGFVYEYAKNN